MRTPPAAPAPAPTLREAVEAWMSYSRELSDENPCPDLGLRARLKAHARALSVAALASPPSGETWERMKELARLHAIGNHYQTVRIFMDGNGHAPRFEDCTFPDCALFAPAPPTETK